MFESVEAKTILEQITIKRQLAAWAQTLAQNLRLQKFNITFLLWKHFRRQAIHAEAPEFADMSVEQEILVTGIKVVDLLAPYVKGGKIGEITDRDAPIEVRKTFLYMIIK